MKVFKSYGKQLMLHLHKKILFTLKAFDVHIILLYYNYVMYVGLIVKSFNSFMNALNVGHIV